MQSLLLFVKRLRQQVSIIFFEPAINYFLGGITGGKEWAEEMCTIFVQKKGVYWLAAI